MAIKAAACRRLAAGVPTSGRLAVARGDTASCSRTVARAEGRLAALAEPL